MAIAAYASVLSLLRVLDNIQHPSRLRFFPDTPHIDDLREKLHNLQEFFENYSSTTIDEDIERRIRKIPRVTYDAESLIGNYVVDRLCGEHTLNRATPSYSPNGVIRKINRVRQKINNNLMCLNIQSEIHRVIEKIDSVNKALKRLRSIQHNQDQPNRVVDKFNGEIPLTNKMVGFDDQLNHVLEKLTGKQRDLIIVPIVGMGGIGKTTLARSVFDHRYNLDHFQVRIWLTISQDYSVKSVVQGLSANGVLGDMNEREGDVSLTELILHLHKKLFAQRYLIVLDDVWSLEAWYDLKQGFPNNGKGSRVIVTTRLSDIAGHLDSTNNSYQMKFLDENKSWDLLREIAFERGGWNLELEEIGREISKRCRGLPLLLVVIGGLLASSNMEIEYWQTVAKDINSFTSSAYDEYCLKILSLSYHHLPIHLKPCFLYMRHFDEDEEIKVSKLIERWVCQGFVKPMRGKTLEEAARKYLEDLVGRNMLLIRRRGRLGKIKFCGIHDILREICIRESEKEQLLDVPRIALVADGFQCVCLLCHTLCTNKTMLDSEILGLDSKYNGKISVCSSCMSTFPDMTKSRFLAALIRPEHFAVQSAVDIPIMTKFRGLSIDNDLRVLDTVNLLWNLEIFHARKGYVSQTHILREMPQLRHVKVNFLEMAEPLSGAPTVLENLQTLKTAVQFRCTEETVRRFPNLRKLGLLYYPFFQSPNKQEEVGSRCDLQNLDHLHKLESLSIRCSVDTISMDFNVIAFPRSLKKLTLKGCKIGWADLSIIGLLPNLEVLKLLDDSVLGKEWNNPNEGEFIRLRSLELVGLNLAQWCVDPYIHFPALESLVFERMEALNSIPREIGELPSLRSVSLILCRQGIIDSARDMVEEQMSSGNVTLVLHVEDLHFRTYQIGGGAS